MTKDIVGRLAGRFLTWKLPADFNPDGGVTFTPEYQNPSGPAKHEPTGTNLLTYAQAVTMVEHMLADLIESLSPPDGVGLPFERDTLGRMVREAWVRWAQTQPNPKPSFLAPYDDLSEADKEADRQIGEAIAKWTMIGVSAQANSPAASPPDGVGLTRYMWTPHGLSRDVVGPPETHWVRYEDAGAALAAEQMAYQSVKNALHAAEKREAAYLARGDEWQAVAEKAGVCMACALGAHEPYGCTDCLNTGWAQGAPPGYVDEAAIAAEKARGDGLDSELDTANREIANLGRRMRGYHERAEAAEATVTERDRRIAEAVNELHCCDDLPLNIGLAEGIAALREARDAARAALSGQQDTGGSDG